MKTLLATAGAFALLTTAMTNAADMKPTADEIDVGRLYAGYRRFVDGTAGLGQANAQLAMLNRFAGQCRIRRKSGLRESKDGSCRGLRFHAANRRAWKDDARRD